MVVEAVTRLAWEALACPTPTVRVVIQVSLSLSLSLSPPSPPPSALLSLFILSRRSLPPLISFSSFTVPQPFSSILPPSFRSSVFSQSNGRKRGLVFIV
jgi:hypothetical protein